MCFGNNNHLTHLDFSTNTGLAVVRFSNNELESLNLKNGENDRITSLRISGNEDLICVEVDNVDAANNSTVFTTFKDDHTNFSTDCGTTQVSLVAYLQGAFSNPVMGEETWMRDDLRLGNSIPTTSPYSDAATCDVSVFTAVDALAVVDWVLIQLRDKDDITTVVKEQSALLLRNGSIVDVDGVSPVTISVQQGNYYLGLKHRNHLSIVTAGEVILGRHNVGDQF